MHVMRDVELFVEVVSARSFTRAAQRLDIPMSTLSRRISALEKGLGVRLLNRTTRKVEPTEAGANYFKRCAPLIEEVRLAHESLSEIAHRVRGTLRLSCTADFAALYLPDVLVTFAKANPEVNVELELSSRRVDLVSENVDAALRIGPLLDSGLIARRIGTLHSWLVASPTYLRLHPSPQEPGELDAHAVVRLHGHSPGPTWKLYPVEGLGPEVPVEAPSRFAAGSMAMARELLLRGAGIGLIDARLAAHDIKTGVLRRVLPNWQGPPTPLHIVTASRLWPARLSRFADELVRELGQSSSRKH
jgi:DNA-binding transcriptional LysR family regulator